VSSITVPGGDPAWSPEASGEKVLRYDRRLKRRLVSEFSALLAEHLPYCDVRYAFWWLVLAATTRTRPSLGPGSGRSTSCSSKRSGAPNCGATMALIGCLFRESTVPPTN
jgi:hypothetical protein